VKVVSFSKIEAVLQQVGARTCLLRETIEKERKKKTKQYAYTSPLIKISELTSLAFTPA